MSGEAQKESVIGLKFDDLTIIEEIKDILMRVQQGEDIPLVSSEHYDLLDRLIVYKNEVDKSTRMFPIASHVRKYNPAIYSPKDGSVFKIREVPPYGNSKQTIKAYWKELHGGLCLVSQNEPNLMFSAHCYEWKPL